MTNSKKLSLYTKVFAYLMIPINMYSHKAPYGHHYDKKRLQHYHLIILANRLRHYSYTERKRELFDSKP